MTIDTGRSASPAGHSQAEPEEVSALRASVTNAMFADLAAAETAAMREATGLSDWHYRDLPQLSLELFDKFVEMVGKDNLRWITLAQRRWPSGNTTKRGQVMISPEGMARLDTHNAASAIEARRAATEDTGAAHESAVGADETPNTGQGTSHG